MSGRRDHTPVNLTAGGHAVTRPAVLIKYTQSWLTSSGVAVQKFAEKLSEDYFRAIPEAMRKAPLRVVSAGGDVEEHYRILGTNAKAVQRYLDGSVPIPSELEEVWVDALPAPFRDAAVFELCSRHRVLPVLLSDETDIHALAEIMRDEAAMIESLAPVLADGEINADDKEAALLAIPNVRKAMSACAGLLTRLEAVTGTSSMTVVGKPTVEVQHG